MDQILAWFYQINPLDIAIIISSPRQMGQSQSALRNSLQPQSGESSALNFSFIRAGSSEAKNCQHIRHTDKLWHDVSDWSWSDRMFLNSYDHGFLKTWTSIPFIDIVDSWGLRKREEAILCFMITNCLLMCPSWNSTIKEKLKGYWYFIVFAFDVRCWW